MYEYVQIKNVVIDATTSTIIVIILVLLLLPLPPPLLLSLPSLSLSILQSVYTYLSTYSFSLINITTSNGIIMCTGICTGVIIGSRLKD